MSDDELRALASTSLNALFTSGVSPPISSMDLLVKIITTKPPAGLFANSTGTPRFRLTDLTRFESILESLSQSWEHGILSLSREGPENRLCVMDVRLGESAANSGLLFSGEISRKRKRVVDEDADSASGGEDADEQSSFGDGAALPSTTLGALSKELREVYSILQKGTSRGRLLAEQHQSASESFEPICPQITKEECVKFQRLSSPYTDPSPCSQIHFRPLIRPHTDPALGHCSYLNTCYSEPTYAQSPSIPPFPSAAGHQQNSNQRGAVSLPSGLGAGGRGKEKAPCRYLHFEVDWDGEELNGGGGINGITKGPRGGSVQGYGRPDEKDVVKRKPYKLGIGMGPDGVGMKVLPPQWINCDLRRFDYSVLGKFHVIMADPPWDIHMSLPYGTMTDDEMRAMPIPTLQDEGLLFLWVTGRAMEVGRECLRVWGYTRVDEVIWVKTNQLQRVIRTGRTGHWLNHTKEHMLVGVKTHIDPTTGALKFPSWANRGLDTDVIVSEVRETSRKPEEVYGLIERMCPGGRKVEIFGRKHNTRPGWLTLGNQLGPDQIYEEDLATRIRTRYPERTVSIPA